MTPIRHFIFGPACVMTPEIFETLPILPPTPEATHRLPAGTLGKAMITVSGRTCWHAIERQFQYGTPVYFARPITIRVYVREPE